MGEIIERRSFPRSDFSSTPWIFALQLEAPTPSEPPLRLEAKNISCSGVKFISNRKIPLFEKLIVDLYLKDGGRLKASLEAKVIRLEEIDTGFGEKIYGIALSFATDTHKVLGSDLLNPA